MRKLTFFTLLAAMLCLPQWMMAKSDPVFGLQDNTGALGSVCVGQTYDANEVLYNHQNLPVTWESSDETIFTVDENGIITPLQDNPVDPVYLRVHTDGDENYNAADGELELWINYPLYLFRYSPLEIKVTPAIAGDILGDGKLSYNYSTHTLTMNNWVVDFETQFSPSVDDDLAGGFLYMDNSTPLTVNLVGTNTITNCNDLFNVDNIVFSGSGSLTVNNDENIINADYLTIDGATLTFNMATDNLDPYQNSTHYGAFSTNYLSVINGGHFHATVSTNVDLSSCGSCFTVGVVGISLTGNILTEHVIWSADPANEASINSYFSMNPGDFIGCFFDDQGGAMLVREVEIGSNGSASTKEDVDMYFLEWDNDLYRDVQITEKEITYDSKGYFVTNTIDFKWSLDGLPDVTFTSSDESILEIETSTNGDTYQIMFDPHSQGTATITATYAGDENYNEATATLTVSMVDGKYYFAPDLVFKQLKEGETYIYDQVVNQITMTEGETVMLPALCHPSSSYREWHISTSGRTMRDHFHFPWLNESENTVYTDRITAHAAGKDTLELKYRFYDDESWNIAKLPIVILPLKQPIADNAESSFDFASVNPAAQESLIFSSSENDSYNSTLGQLVVGTTLTPADVEAFISRNAAGTAEWLDALHGSLTVNLPAGQGTYSVECYAESGYEFKLKIRGQAAVTISQTSMATAQVNFDLVEPTAVILYLTATGGGAPAPKHAPAAKMDAAKGYIKSIAIAPRVDVTAKQDPDNSGVYYSTFYDGTRKCELPAGVEAYAATINGSGDMVLAKVAEGGQVLPANTAVILKANTASLSLTPTDGSAVTVSAANQLLGVDEPTAAMANCYVLSGHSTDNSVTGVGFYAFSGTIPAHKAYLIYSGASLAPSHRMRFIFETTTAIDNTDAAVKSEKRIENGQLIIIKNGVRYNAQGQVVK